MRSNALTYVIKRDMYREAGLESLREFFRLVRANPSFRWLFAFRLHQALRKGSIGSRMLRPIVSVWLGMLSRKYGIHISNQAEIGPGLYIGHYGGIWVGPGVVIGQNCNLNHGVTLGGISEGPSKGYPTIGDRVYLGPGSVIVGAISVGNEVSVGANSVVVIDVLERTVVLGSPAKVFSKTGSSHHIHHCFPESEDFTDRMGNVTWP
jgi:serine O-acetyltransferase